MNTSPEPPQEPSEDKKKILPVHIRWMIRRDMPEVLNIENSSSDSPWSEEDFIKNLQQRNCIGMIAERDDRVVGFMVYDLHKNRIHVHNFAVDPEFHRHGIGTQMVEKLESKLSQGKRTKLLLEVNETNLPAQLFFKHCGFKATNTLRGHYDDTPEDAYIMQYNHVPRHKKVLKALNRLEEITGTQWEIVQHNKINDSEALGIEEINENNSDYLFLRTRFGLKDAKEAKAAINELWGITSYIDRQNPNAPGQLIIAIYDISPIRMGRGKENELAAAFTPAEQQWQTRVRKNPSSERKDSLPPY